MISRFFSGFMWTGMVALAALFLMSIPDVTLAGAEFGHTLSEVIVASLILATVGGLFSAFMK